MFAEMNCYSNLMQRLFLKKNKNVSIAGFIIEFISLRRISNIAKPDISV